MIALFDLDGTLTDPKTGITRSIQYALDRLGRPVPDADELTWMIGPPLIASFTKLLGSPEDAQEALRLYRERFGASGLFENEVYEGIPALLQDLRDQGVRLFVATSKPHVYARRILDHFELSRFFAGIYGSELDNRNADKRDLIRHILEQERFDPARAVMIGDREHDAIGAKANGLASIGVTWGYGSRQELLDAGVACLVDAPQDLAESILTRAATMPRPAAAP
ncbi:HAD family hydrolase [Microvirga arsenatis]|uniref:HAD hydrolase-like protein n=1 Tax=Microvirga arsenatis TaxID=2692265 RepID=A0ABW9YWT8_9HYPH|nr:HAD family hydrolase [Microvirga arsenatis]NBJ10237.1 HAD hydrolase-like protein [Microvirga arsenatis]NBJ24864.1 HAD hydrolase-like protein [Microvirga arsenatis]